MSDGPDVTPEDALAVAQRALSKTNELGELETQVEDLQERVVALELRLSEYSDERDYRDLTLDDKIGMVREHAFNKAAGSGGRTKLDYSDVMWEVFDGEPSADHCYKLMRLAAGGEDTDSIPGFKMANPDTGNKHLRVDADRAKSHVMFSSAKKDSSGGVV